jgi:hypothetical protein
LNWNTKPRLRFTTLQPTLLPGTTPKPSSTTSTRPHIALQPTLPTEAPKYYTTTKLRNHYSDPTYYTTKTAEYYTTNYASGSYYKEIPKYLSQNFYLILFMFRLSGHWSLEIYC